MRKMDKKPTYEELLSSKKKLEEKVEWLESNLKEHQQDGMRVRTRFLANISHEVRTPMNAIMGFSNLLADNNLDNDQKEEYLNHINYNSNTLLQILDNLIDLTLLETGNLRLRKEEVELESLLRQIYDFYNQGRHRSGKTQVAMLLDLDDSVRDITIHTDGIRLSRIIGCLVENALSLTKMGFIEIAAFLQKDVLRFTVKDSAGSISGERASRIFEKNEHRDDWFNYSDRIGLGYSLARGLAEMMGGSVRVDSNQQNGCTIVAEIPVYVAEREDRTNVTRIKLKSILI